jgi:hypothetical protein
MESRRSAWRTLKAWTWDEGWAWILGALLCCAAFGWITLYRTAPGGPVSLLVFTGIAVLLLIVPGRLLLMGCGYSDPSLMGRTVFTVALSLAASSGILFALYMAGIYTRPALLVGIAGLALGAVPVVRAFAYREFLHDIRSAWRQEDPLGRLTVVFLALYMVNLFATFGVTPFVA